MQLLQRRISSAVVSSLLILIGGMGALAVHGQGVAVPANSGDLDADAAEAREENDRNKVFRRAPRDLRQPLLRAKRAIDEQRFTDAVDELGRLLASDAIGESDAQDFFLPETTKDGRLIQLREEASRLLGAMPAAGREWYELGFGAQARALLQQGLASGKEDLMAEVVRKYFHTEAGHNAVMLMGRYQLAQGRPLAAAITLNRLSQSAQARRFEPELSLLLATAWAYSNRAEQARSTLLELKRGNRDAILQIGDEKIQLFQNDEDALAWLDRTIGKRNELRVPQSIHWVLHRGDPTRNARSKGSVPLLNYRWQLRVANDPQDEMLVKKLAKQFASQRIPAMPGLNPLVIDDVVLMRTTERLLGVDFQSGKRVWDYPWGDPLQNSANGSPAGRSPSGAASPRQRELQQRLWEDAPYGQLSSDRDSVYFIDELGYAFSDRYNVTVLRRGLLRSNPGMPKSHNVLVSLTLRSQGKRVDGKLRWLIGGASGEDEPKLAGAFFLGPPLPRDGKLYVLAEVNGEIRLVVLNAETGGMEWFQQLAHVDDRSILIDPGRRLAGASPSYSGGVLVCPTSAGAVVAVDVARRCLLWGYAYERNNQPPKQISFSTVMPVRLKELGDRWADATCTIADGRVLITPLESDQLHCLDLLTGEVLWTLPRGDMLYVAGVYQQKAIVVAQHAVKALDLETGKDAWKEEVDLESEMPSGRGFLSGGHYFLATTGSELLRIQVADGQVASRTPTMRPLGNLICYKDHVISQGPDYLAVYYQTEPLRERVAEMLREDPDNGEALALHGELLLHDGKRHEAVETLRKAYLRDANNDTTRSLLVRTYLSALQDDFRMHISLADEIEPLIDQPQQRSNFLQILAAGYQREGQLSKAFSAYLRLASLKPLERGASVEQELEHVHRDHAVRRERWVQARLGELIAEASPADREQMNETIAARLEQVLTGGNLSELRQFTSYFASHELADRAKLELARRLIAAREYLEAELFLDEVSLSREASLAAAATAEMARLLTAVERFSEAAKYYRRLADDFPEVICCENQTGRQFFERAQSGDPRLARTLLRPQDAWLSGKVKVTEGGEQINRSPSYHRVYPIRLTEQRGSVPDGIRVALDQYPYALVIRDPLGAAEVKVSLRRSDGARYYTGNYHLAHAKINGHMLIVSVGFEMIAIDLLRAKQNPNEAILWREDLRLLIPGRSPSSQRVHSKALSTPWGSTNYIATTSDGASIGQLGPFNRAGLCYQRRQELVCVDPLTGLPIWSRDNVPAGSRLFGDEDLLFVIPPQGNKNKIEQMLVYNNVDGQLLKKFDMDRSFSTWATHGRRALMWKQEDQQLRLKLWDCWTQQALWERTYPNGSKGDLVETDEVAILQPDGKFELLSLQDGRAPLRAQLEPEATLTDLEMMRGENRYFVLAQSPMKVVSGVNLQAVPNMISMRVASARVYALNRKSGELVWPAPAVVENFAFPPDQPPQAPVLTFLRHRMVAASGQRTGPRTTSALCLDKRDGRVAFWNDSIATSTHLYEVIAQPAKNTVMLILPKKTFTLTFTDEPTPPEPPAQVGALKPPTSLQDTVLKVANGVFNAFGKMAPHKVYKPAAPGPDKPAE